MNFTLDIDGHSRPQTSRVAPSIALVVCLGVRLAQYFLPLS